MDRVLQGHRRTRFAVVELEEARRRNLEQAGPFAHARRRSVRRALDHGEIADQLARPRNGDSSLPFFLNGKDLHGAAYDEVARGGGLAGREDLRAALELEDRAAGRELFQRIGVEAFGKRQDRQESSPIEGWSGPVAFYGRGMKRPLLGRGMRLDLRV